VFTICEVPENAAEESEQLGTKPKFWFTSVDGRKLLFKEARPGTGEDWAEKLASELSGLIGLPHAEYHLASWRGRRGVVTQSFVPDRSRLILGNELLGRVVTGYDGEKVYDQRQHTVRTVMALLHRIPLATQTRAGTALSALQMSFVGISCWMR
jgi:hypothetical protein